MKLTKNLVDKIKPPVDKAQAFYRDEQLKGFALRITAGGAKSFVVETSGYLSRPAQGQMGATHKLA